MEARSRLLLLLTVLSGLLAIIIGYVIVPVKLAEQFIIHGGYYFMLFVFGAFVWLLRDEFWPALYSRLPHLYKSKALYLVLVCSCYVWLADNGRYKVLFDEYVLQDTAEHMHFTKEISTVVRAYNVEGSFSPIDTFLDKRPYFFTFLVCLLHDLTGYRESNIFTLNLLLVPLLLGAVYLIARRLGGWHGACWSLLLLSTLPILCQTASGAGMELHNLTMIVITCLLSLYYLESPSPRSLSLLCLSCVLLTQSRYESALYVGPVAVVILYGWLRSRSLIVSWFLVLTPLLLVPYAWHNRVLSASPALWQLKKGQTTRFSLGYFPENVQAAKNFFLSRDQQLANSFPLALLGALGLLYCSFLLVRRLRLLKRERPEPARLVFFLFGSCMFGSLLLMQFYYWAQLDDPQASRFSLPAYLTLAWCVALLATASIFRRFWAQAVFYAALVYLSFYYTLPQISRHIYSERILLAKELEWECSYVRDLEPANRLIITNGTCLSWLAMKIPVISVGVANSRIDQVAYHYREGTFREILIFELLENGRPAGTHQVNPLPGQSLSDRFVVKVVGYHNTGGRIMRVSRLLRVLPAPSLDVDLQGTVHPSARS